MVSIRLEEKGCSYDCLTQEANTTSTKYAKVIEIHGTKDNYGVYVTGEYSDYYCDFSAKGLEQCLIVDWQDDLGDYMPLHPNTIAQM